MQNPGQTFHTYVQDHSRIYMEKQGSRKLRVILKKESKIGRLNSDFKTYYMVTAVKTVRY